MKYPYIGKSHQGNSYLVENSNAVYSFVSKSWVMDADGFDPMENITHEYLSNTYGEVVSPEHAEFIIELCRVNGIQTIYSSRASEAKSFEIGNRHVSLYSFGINEINVDSKKQITIPLPPKQIQTATPEEEFEMKQIMKNAGDNLVFGYEEDFKVAREIINELREEANCSDELLASRDEWPKIGDEVLVYNIVPDSRVVDFNNEKVEVIAKTKNDRGTVLTVSHPSKGIGAIMLVSEHVKKPKTPEEELRDELTQVLADSYTYVTEVVKCKSTFAHYAKDLMSKYNITKKPQ